MKAEIIEVGDRITLRVDNATETWCYADETQAETLREIARRVNAHEGLVASLERAMLHLDINWKTYDDACRALDLARGEVTG